MIKIKYDLEERTENFSKKVIQFVKSEKVLFINNEILKQLIRSAGSVGANYIEANEALSRKDFIYRMKICLKEIKETMYWLNLLGEAESKSKPLTSDLYNEALELKKIFCVIIEKTIKSRLKH